MVFLFFNHDWPMDSRWTWTAGKHGRQVKAKRQQFWEDKDEENHLDNKLMQPHLHSSLTHSLTRLIHSFIHLFILISLLHSFYLLSLMATPEDKIRDLKAQIATYEAELDAATTEFANSASSKEDKKVYVVLITTIYKEITECRKTINLLLQQQQPR